MSATITYKGQTLATVANQTKVLKTMGKYLEDDLTIVDAGGSGGNGFVLVESLPDIVVALADTDYATWTPATSAKVILPNRASGTFVATDVGDYDYFVRQRVFLDVQYVEGTATAKGMFQFCAADNWNVITRRAANVTQLNAGNLGTNVAEAISHIYLLKYYNTSWANIYSSAYGFYPTNTLPSLSSTSAAAPTVTVRTPAIYSKCQATYFSTAMAAAVDQQASTIKIKADIYRAETGYMRGTAYKALADMWLHKL